MLANGDRRVRTVQPDDELGRIDLNAIVAMIRRRWIIIAAIFIASVAAALFAYTSTDKIYSSTARVVVDRRSDELVPTEKQPPALTADSAAVDTEVQKLRSVDLARAVAQRLRLDRDPAFVGDNVGTGDAVARAASRLLADLAVKREGTSFAIEVSYKNGSAARAAQVVNTLVDVYQNGSVEQRDTTRRETVRLLEDKLGKLRGDMVQAEAAVARYRIANGIISATPNDPVRQGEVSNLNTELARARAEQAEAASRLAAARSAVSRTGGTPGGQATDNAVVAELRRQQALLGVERGRIADRYGARHPRITELDNQLAEIDRRIQAESRRILTGLEAEAQAAAGRANSLNRAANGAEGAVMDQTAASVRLNELERNAESARGLYQAFLNEYRSTVAQTGTDRSNVSVISRGAVPANPDWPSLPFFLLLGLIVGTLLSALVLFVLNLRENGIVNRDQLRRKLGIGAIGNVPDLNRVPGVKLARGEAAAPSTYVLDHPGSAYAESIRALRALVTPGAGEAGRAIAITSALPAEGKSTLAMSLALSAAAAGQQVLLIDTDLRRRASSRALAGDVSRGLVEVLEGRLPLSEALVRDSRSGAYLLPQLASDTDKFDVLTPDAIERVIAEAKARFSLVILDCAPVLPVAESRIVAAAADATLFAIRWRRTPARAGTLALAQLEQHGVKVMGGVLTLVDLKAQAAAGYDEAAFYGRYKAYYA